MARYARIAAWPLSRCTRRSQTLKLKVGGFWNSNWGGYREEGLLQRICAAHFSPIKCHLMLQIGQKKSKSPRAVFCCLMPEKWRCMTENAAQVPRMSQTTPLQTSLVGLPEKEAIWLICFGLSCPGSVLLSQLASRRGAPKQAEPPKYVASLWDHLPGVHVSDYKDVIPNRCHCWPNTIVLNVTMRFYCNSGDDLEIAIANR